MVDSRTHEQALLPAIADRRSVVAFDRQPIEKETLDALVQAARWAPSSRNRQPWRVTLVQRSDESRGALESALSGNNQQWAPDAPLLVVYACVPPDAERPDQLAKLFFDCGLSAQNLMLEAVHQGLRVHPMGGWDEDSVKAALGIPDEFRVAVVIAAGYAGDPASLPEAAREKEFRARERAPVEEHFYSGRFGAPWS